MVAILLPSLVFLWVYVFQSQRNLLMNEGFQFCLITLCVTLRSNFLINRINFIHGHKLLPCLQQRLLQVYRKMFIPTTDDNVVESFILYDIIFLFIYLI